jgi:thiamine biosynthesis protein ThiS
MHRNGDKMLVNGERTTLEKEITLDRFVKEAGFQLERIAVEKNGEIISKAMYSECVLNDNDTLEIVHFVGGG